MVDRGRGWSSRGSQRRGERVKRQEKEKKWKTHTAALQLGTITPAAPLTAYSHTGTHTTQPEILYLFHFCYCNIAVSFTDFCLVFIYFSNRAIIQVCAVYLALVKKQTTFTSWFALLFIFKSVQEMYIKL